jgi:hypothetical protein
LDGNASSHAAMQMSRDVLSDTSIHRCSSPARRGRTVVRGWCAGFDHRRGRVELTRQILGWVGRLVASQDHGRVDSIADAVVDLGGHRARRAVPRGVCDHGVVRVRRGTEPHRLRHCARPHGDGDGDRLVARLQARRAPDLGRGRFVRLGRPGGAALGAACADPDAGRARRHHRGHHGGLGSAADPSRRPHGVAIPLESIESIESIESVTEIKTVPAGAVNLALMELGAAILRRR